jgi:hypothetical protein
MNKASRKVLLVLVLPKSDSEPKFEPKLSWTGPEVRSKVHHSPMAPGDYVFAFSKHGHKLELKLESEQKESQIDYSRLHK